MSSEEVTLLVFQGHMLFSEWHYLATLPSSYKEIIWYKLTSPIFPAKLAEVSHPSKASWSLTASLQTTEVIKLKKLNRHEAKKYSDANLRRCEIPQLKRFSLPCCAASAAKPHSCLKMLNLTASSRKQQCNTHIMFLSVLMDWIFWCRCRFLKRKIKPLGNRCPPSSIFSAKKRRHCWKNRTLRHLAGAKAQHKCSTKLLSSMTQHLVSLQDCFSNTDSVQTFQTGKTTSVSDLILYTGYELEDLSN